ncbi:hypothetical protein [Legionella cardiaca]|uniref:LidA long coiled-coil domain-containing protein n=1 Tax=Legionella cardiaca TaxID=1071983 RepID=A0ABY8AUP7_9GAMM|nr:hypothetical protein [Legionella cardiaca]WED43116.1 hypothetical protein PXX05_14640 [Legionella cardiaca]
MLNKNDTLNDSNRASAKQAFIDKKADLLSIKDLVKSNRSIEISELDKKINHIATKINILQTQKNLSQSADDERKLTHYILKS